MALTKAQKEKVRAGALARWIESYKILATGKCPECGTKLYRNLSLPGWYQCGHLGAVGFQKEPGPHCSFQFFYDVSPQQHQEVLKALGISQ